MTLSYASLSEHAVSVVTTAQSRKNSPRCDPGQIVMSTLVHEEIAKHARPDDMMALPLAHPTFTEAESGLSLRTAGCSHSPEDLSQKLPQLAITPESLGSLTADGTTLHLLSPPTPSTVGSASTTGLFVNDGYVRAQSNSTAATSWQPTPSINADSATSLSLQSTSHESSRLHLCDFTPEKVLGSGSYAYAHLCTYRPMNVQVVLKVFDKRFAKPRMVVNEQKILRLLGSDEQHSSTRLLGSFHNSRYFFLVFNYLAQGDLKDRIQRHGALPLSLVRLYLAELLLGLADIHKLGIVHRDIKPENIFLDEDGHLVIGDFGLAKLLVPVGLLFVPGAPCTRRTREVAGTARYMAPEVFLGKPYGLSADMYCVGGVGIEMLTGRPPWPGSGNEPTTELEKHIVHETIDDYLAGKCDIDSTARAFLGRLLPKNPKSRPTVEQAMTDKFFEGVDWECIRQRRTLVPDFGPPLPRAQGGSDSKELLAHSFGDGGAYMGDDDPIPEFNYVSPALALDNRKSGLQHPTTFSPVLANGNSSPPSPCYPSPVGSCSTTCFEEVPLDDAKEAHLVAREQIAHPLYAVCSQLPCASDTDTSANQARLLVDVAPCSSSSPSSSRDCVESPPAFIPKCTSSRIVAWLAASPTEPAVVFVSSSPIANITPIIGPYASRSLGVHIHFPEHLPKPSEERYSASDAFELGSGLLTAVVKTVSADSTWSSLLSALKTLVKKALRWFKKTPAAVVYVST